MAYIDYDTDSDSDLNPFAADAFRDDLKFAWCVARRPIELLRHVPTYAWHRVGWIYNWVAGHIEGYWHGRA